MNDLHEVQETYQEIFGEDLDLNLDEIQAIYSAGLGYFKNVKMDNTETIEDSDEMIFLKQNYEGFAAAY